MADIMRWRYGETNAVLAAVDSPTIIEIGDLLFLDTDEKSQLDVKPASLLSPPNQGLFRDRFIGVAMQRSRSGDTESIRVATTGVFEFDCGFDSYEIGDLIGIEVSADSSQWFLCDQFVAKVIDEKLAIGRCAYHTANANKKVLICINTIMCRS